ncbi:MAG: hypothetical protein AB7S38_26360 [Vulcanimicrobiota bacterium]
MHRLVMLGRDHPGYGELALETIDGVFAAISVGSDRSSPSLTSKGDSSAPNEDALAIICEADSCLVAVADAHFGAEASHQLLSRLVERCAGVPKDAMQLTFITMGLTDPPARSRSGTTLAVACLDRFNGRGFGISFGDSTLAAIGSSGHRVLNRPTDVYLHLDAAVPMAECQKFDFELQRDEFLLAYTDGVNECHYRSPQTSIRKQHFEEFFRVSQGNCQTFCRVLGQAALNGIEGQPGGQDNLALVVAGLRS